MPVHCLIRDANGFCLFLYSNFGFDSDRPRAYLSRVRRFLALVLCLWAILPAAAATGRVLKVLPEYLDLKGRNSLSPSLYGRDAYQVYLRENVTNRSGIRFYTQWKLKGDPAAKLTLRIELRGVAQGKLPKELVIEAPVPPKHGWFSHWTNLTLAGEEYKRFGQVTAWRVTFWEGNRLLDQQQSFLW